MGADDLKDALAQLREAGEAVAAELASSSARCARDDYAGRLALVYTASEMRHRATLHFLTNLVDTPVPSDPKLKEAHSAFGRTGQEMVLRTAAIEGIGGLLADGHQEALDPLLGCLAQPYVSIQRAALQSLRSAGADAEVIARARELVSKDRHLLFDVKLPHVSEVPQVSDPRSTLREGAEQERAPAPPDLLPDDERRRNAIPGASDKE